MRCLGWWRRFPSAPWPWCWAKERRVVGNNPTLGTLSIGLTPRHDRLLESVITLRSCQNYLLKNTIPSCITIHHHSFSDDWHPTFHLNHRFNVSINHYWLLIWFYCRCSIQYWVKLSLIVNKMERAILFRMSVIPQRWWLSSSWFYQHRCVLRYSLKFSLDSYWLIT